MMTKERSFEIVKELKGRREKERRNKERENKKERERIESEKVVGVGKGNVL